jgi:hypothetical protein
MRLLLCEAPEEDECSRAEAAAPASCPAVEGLPRGEIRFMALLGATG